VDQSDEGEPRNPFFFLSRRVKKYIRMRQWKKMAKDGIWGRGGRVRGRRGTSDEVMRCGGGGAEGGRMVK